VYPVCPRAYVASVRKRNTPTVTRKMTTMTRTVFATHRRAGAHPPTTNRGRTTKMLTRSLATIMYVSMCVSYVRERWPAASFDGEWPVEGTRGEGRPYTSLVKSQSSSLSLVLRTSSTCPPSCLATNSWRDRAVQWQFGRFWPTSPAKLIETHARTHTRTQ